MKNTTILYDGENINTPDDLRITIMHFIFPGRCFKINGTLYEVVGFHKTWDRNITVDLTQEIVYTDKDIIKLIIKNDDTVLFDSKIVKIINIQNKRRPRL